MGTLDAGGWKWHGGVVGRDGCVYGLPSNADCVLKVDPFAQRVTTIPFTYTQPRHRQPVDGKYKYAGGVLGPDGRIYCVPSDAMYVLRIDPATEEVVEIGACLEGKVGPRGECNKWQNGFVAADGRIYAIPLKADCELCID